MTYTTAYFASILGLLIIALALNVSRTRIKHKISFGDGGIKELKGAIRAHGNAIENVPFILILLFFYEVEAQQCRYSVLQGRFAMETRPHKMPIEWL